jgi:hypothetical protein
MDGIRVDERDLEAEQARTRAFIDQVCAGTRELGEGRLEIGDLVGHVMHTRPSLRQEAADGGVLREWLEQLDAALANTDGRRPDSLISYRRAVLDLRAEQPLVGHEGRIEVLDRDP